MRFLILILILSSHSSTKAYDLELDEIIDNIDLMVIAGCGFVDEIAENRSFKSMLGHIERVDTFFEGLGRKVKRVDSKLQKAYDNIVFRYRLKKFIRNRFLYPINGFISWISSCFKSFFHL